MAVIMNCVGVWLSLIAVGWCVACSLEFVFILCSLAKIGSAKSSNPARNKAEAVIVGLLGFLAAVAHSFALVANVLSLSIPFFE